MQQRYMDAELGRFLTPDPVGPEEDFINHFNRYNYAMNNPVRYTDPDGNIPNPYLGRILFDSLKNIDPGPHKSFPTIAEAAKYHANQNENGWGRLGAQGPVKFWTKFKCNIFVNQVSKEAGYLPPMVNGRPAVADELANPNLKIAGWAVVKDGELNVGDILSHDKGGVGYTGHTGVVVKQGKDLMLASASSRTGSISITREGVNGNKAAEGYTARRYTGTKSHYNPDSGSHISRRPEK
jgi:hypothetical protein